MDRERKPKARCDRYAHAAHKHCDEGRCRPTVNNYYGFHCCKGGTAGDCKNCRMVLDDHLEIYVRKDGNDDNDGFTDSPKGAKLTITAAIEALHGIHARGYDVKIIVHEGVYEESLVLNQSLKDVSYGKLTLAAFESEKVTVASNDSDGVLIWGLTGVYLERLIILVKHKVSGLYCVNAIYTSEVNCTDCELVAEALAGSILGCRFHCSANSSMIIDGTIKINIGTSWYAFAAGS